MFSRANNFSTYQRAENGFFERKQYFDPSKGVIFHPFSAGVSIALAYLRPHVRHCEFSAVCFATLSYVVVLRVVAKKTCATPWYQRPTCSHDFVEGIVVHVVGLGPSKRAR